MGWKEVIIEDIESLASTNFGQIIYTSLLSTQSFKRGAAPGNKGTGFGVRGLHLSYTSSCSYAFGPVVSSPYRENQNTQLSCESVPKARPC